MDPTTTLLSSLLNNAPAIAVIAVTLTLSIRALVNLWLRIVHREEAADEFDHSEKQGLLKLFSAQLAAFGQINTTLASVDHSIRSAADARQKQITADIDALQALTRQIQEQTQQLSAQHEAQASVVSILQELAVAVTALEGNSARLERRAEEGIINLSEMLERIRDYIEQTVQQTLEQSLEQLAALGEADARLEMLLGAFLEQFTRLDTYIRKKLGGTLDELPTLETAAEPAAGNHVAEPATAGIGAGGDTGTCHV